MSYEKLLAGDRRTMARAMTAVENRTPEGLRLLRDVYSSSGKARVIGITGSPGAGKSTLVEKLAGEFRRQAQRVGVVAVDPTSPFSGGAILGDRIRMNSLFADEGVYIRSMATRGQLGGLALATQDVVTLLDAAGYGTILVETVGVGQDEIDIARYADVTLLVLVPGMGDDVQTFKAGVMEIADIFVINKADQPGTERVEQELRAMLAISPRADGWVPLILRTVATESGGIGELGSAVRQFEDFAAGELFASRRAAQARRRLMEVVRQRLLERVLLDSSEATLTASAEAMARWLRDPYTLADEILKDSLGSTPGIHHVGIAVESLAAAVPVFEKILGRGPSGYETVADQKVRIAVFDLNESRVELLEPTSSDSPVARFLAKRGQGIHHLTLTAEDLGAKLQELEAAGIRLIDREPRIGAGGERIAFLHPSTAAGTLIELVEKKEA